MPKIQSVFSKSLSCCYTRDLSASISVLAPLINTKPKSNIKESQLVHTAEKSAFSRTGPLLAWLWRSFSSQLYRKAKAVPIPASALIVFLGCRFTQTVAKHHREELFPGSLARLFIFLVVYLSAQLGLESLCIVFNLQADSSVS